MSEEESINMVNPTIPKWSPEPNKSYSFDKPETKPKIVRVLTVIAYILSVSLAAILLSIYYIFLWKEESPQMSPLRSSNCNTKFNKSLQIPASVSPPSRMVDDMDEILDNVLGESVNITENFTDPTVLAFPEKEMFAYNDTGEIHDSLPVDVEENTKPSTALLNSQENTTDLYDDFHGDTFLKKTHTN